MERLVRPEPESTAEPFAPPHGSWTLALAGEQSAVLLQAPTVRFRYALDLLEAQGARLA